MTHTLNPGILTFQELLVHEPLPLSTLHGAVIDYLRDRDDIAMSGAHAVNAYVDEPRMTQDINLLSTRAADIADELRDFLAARFQIATQVRELGRGSGYRLDQLRKSGNRHLVDVRPVDVLPETRTMANVLVIAPADLVAAKVIAYHRRRGQPKSGTDWRDIALLLLAFPELAAPAGDVADRLQAAGVDEATLATWREIAAQRIEADDQDAE